MIKIIAAVGLNNSLGKDNDLPWHLPNDFKRFKELTTGSFILMGRKTFESFPKPLPNRKHLIITGQKDYSVPENCFIFSEIEKAIDFANSNLWIIGGGEIYKQTIEIADLIELTRINSNFDADTFFPEITDRFKISSEVKNLSDEKHKYNYDYLTYKIR